MPEKTPNVTFNAQESIELLNAKAAMLNVLESAEDKMKEMKKQSEEDYQIIKKAVAILSFLKVRYPQALLAAVEWYNKSETNKK